MVTRHRRLHLPSLGDAVLFITFAAGFVWFLVALAQEVCK